MHSQLPIVTVNFMCQFTEQRDAQIDGKILYLSMSVWMSPEVISIWISRLSKDAFTSVGRHYPTHWGPKQNKKWEEGWFCSDWAGTSIFSRPWTSVPLVFRPLDLDWNLYHQLPWFSGLGTWHSWFSACRQQTMGFLKPPSSHASFPSPFGVIFQYPILIY